MLGNQEIKALVNELMLFFREKTEREAKPGSPYLLSRDVSEPMDYLQGLRIFGQYNGVLCYSMTQSMVRHLAQHHGSSVVNLNDDNSPLGTIMNFLHAYFEKRLSDESIARPWLHPALDELSSKVPFLVIPISWEGHNSRLFLSID